MVRSGKLVKLVLFCFPLNLVQKKVATSGFVGFRHKARFLSTGFGGFDRVRRVSQGFAEYSPGFAGFLRVLPGFNINSLVTA